MSSNGRAAPFVSIVVPTRNRARLLRDCIVSLMQQDLPADRYEIIVVDDGSTDETPDVVREIRRRTNRPDIRYVRPEPRNNRELAMEAHRSRDYSGERGVLASPPKLRSEQAPELKIPCRSPVPHPGIW